MGTVIGNSIGVPFKAPFSWVSYWAPTIKYSSRSGLDLLETGSEDNLNAKIIPACAKCNATNYLTRTVANFNVAAASGYVEAKFYYDGNTNASSTYVFTSSDISLTTKYMQLRIASGYPTISVRGATGGAFINTVRTTDTLAAGWHTIRWASDGANYTITVDGVAKTVANGGLLVSGGSDNGIWFSRIDARDNISVGALVTSTTYTTYSEIKVAYIDIDNAYKWVFTGQGLYEYDIIGDQYLTWVGTSHSAYDVLTTTTLLDSGYSLWSKYGVADEYVPYKAGAAYDVSAFLVGYRKVSDHEGSATTYNLAPSLVDFDYADATPVKLAILDRSSTTYQTDASRASSDYDATNVYRYHSSKLANPTVYNTLFKAGYRGIFHSKITTSDVSYNYAPTSILEMYINKTDVKGNIQYKIMESIGSHVFAASNKALDADGYILTLLTDIKHFGASPSLTDNYIPIQRAINYLSNSTLTFGATGETYTINRDLAIKSRKTYTVSSTIKIKNGTFTTLAEDVTAGDTHVHLTSVVGFNIGETIAVIDDLQESAHGIYRGWTGRITNIVGNACYLDTTYGSNIAVASNGRVGHAQCTVIADEVNNFVITGTGTIDNNKANQIPVIPAAVEITPENWWSGIALSVIYCTDFTIDIRCTNGLLHSLAINGLDTTHMCDTFHLGNNTICTNAVFKNILIRYAQNITGDTIEGTGAEWEDGVIFYIACKAVAITKIIARNNYRSGFAWNSSSGLTLTSFAEGALIGEVETSGNAHGVAVATKWCKINKIRSTDYLRVIDAYTCNNVELNDVELAGVDDDNVLYLSGGLTDVAINELVITGCTGIGIKAVQLSGEDPVVSITGGGIYDHTGTKFDFSAGSAITITDFDNYP